jgi:hypothetical protein
MLLGGRVDFLGGAAGCRRALSDLGPVGTLLGRPYPRGWLSLGPKGTVLGDCVGDTSGPNGPADGAAPMDWAIDTLGPVGAIGGNDFCCITGLLMGSKIWLVASVSF